MGWRQNANFHNRSVSIEFIYRPFTLFGKIMIHKTYLFTFVKVLVRSQPYKKLAIGIILIALIFQTFSLAMVKTDYLLRTESYAALCLNKDKPEMHCEGKCQMTRKMQQENDNDKNNPQNNVDISVVYFVSDYSIVDIISPDLADRENKYFSFQETATFQHPQDIFRPPVIV